MKYLSNLYEDFEQYSVDTTNHGDYLASQENWIQTSGDAQFARVEDSTLVFGTKSVAIYSPLDSTYAEAAILFDNPTEDYKTVCYVKLTADAYPKVTDKPLYFFVASGTTASYPWTIAIHSDDVEVTDNGGSSFIGFNPGTSIHEYKIITGPSGGWDLEIDGVLKYSGTVITLGTPEVDQVVLGAAVDDQNKLIAYVDHISFYRHDTSYNIGKILVGG
jgi:hypothetical protein